MTDPADLLRQLAARVESDPRVDLHRFPVRIDTDAQGLVVEGDVENVAAKRLVLRHAIEIAGGDAAVRDALRIVPAHPRPDADMLASLTRVLLAQPVLRNCRMQRRRRGDIETVRRVPNAGESGAIEFGVSDGVIELDGSLADHSLRRIVGALAWSVRGCRNVVDRLRVEPTRPDSDDALANALRQVLDGDPLLPEAERLAVRAEAGVVALEGAVHEEAQKRRAELDAWGVDGVREVRNTIRVLP